jgi:hypothetical protein
MFTAGGIDVFGKVSMSEDPAPYETSKPGRPPDHPAGAKKAKGIRIAVDVFEFLATIDGQTAFIESAIRKTKEFREWKINQVKKSKD